MSTPDALVHRLSWFGLRSVVQHADGHCPALLGLSRHRPPVVVMLYRVQALTPGGLSFPTADYGVARLAFLSQVHNNIPCRLLAPDGSTIAVVIFHRAN